MLTIEQAVMAAVERYVAAERAWGRRVWIARCEPWKDTSDPQRAVFHYVLAIDDMEAVEFAPYYSGSADDLVPEGFDDFCMYFAGGKDTFTITAPPPDGHEPEPYVYETLTAPDGTQLRFVTRIDSPESEREWFARPDAYVMCDRAVGEDPVRVGDPEGECVCGAFSHDDHGHLVWSEKDRWEFPRVYLPITSPEAKP
jgi:hypothetical protein